MIHFLFHRNWGPWRVVRVSMDDYSAGNLEYFKNKATVQARTCTQCSRKQMKRG